jgi:hypothetical protein
MKGKLKAVLTRFAILEQSPGFQCAFERNGSLSGYIPNDVIRRKRFRKAGRDGRNMPCHVGTDPVVRGAQLDGWKPSVMTLAVFTALVGLADAPRRLEPLNAFVAILAIAAGAGAAGMLNMWYAKVKDRRARAIWLTAAGRKHLQEAAPLWKAAHDHVFAALGQSEAQMLSQMLDRSLQRLDPVAADQKKGNNT